MPKRRASPAMAKMDIDETSVIMNSSIVLATSWASPAVGDEDD
jgi:hypothetical protein